MVVRNFVILMIASIFFGACSKGTDAPSVTFRPDADKAQSSFVPGTINPRSTSELPFDSFAVYLPRKENSQSKNPKQPTIEIIQGFAPPVELQFVTDEDEESPNLLCSHDFDPMATTSSAHMMADLAIARLYFCNQLWDAEGSGVTIEFSSLESSCKQNTEATKPCHFIRASGNGSMLRDLPVERSALLYHLSLSRLENSQVLFLLNHLEETLWFEPSTVKAPKDLQNFSKLADRIELFTFEHQAIKNSLSVGLSSYWATKSNQDISVYEKMVSADVLIELVVRKNYEALALFARSSATNSLSSQQSLSLGAGIPVRGGLVSRNGLSPLMAASLLKDKRAMEILLQVPNVNPELKSDVYNETFRTLGQWEPSQFHGFYASSPKSPPTPTTPTTQPTRPDNPPSPTPRRPFHQKDRDVVLGNDCENCTELMLAVYENRCEDVDKQLSQDNLKINKISKNGISALKIGMMKNQCLVNLVGHGANPQMHGAYLVWIAEKELGLLQMMPENFWLQLSKLEKQRLVQLLLGQSWITQAYFENVFKMEASTISQSITDLGFEHLSVSKNGLNILIAYRLNPFKLKNANGLTLLDQFLAKRKGGLIQKLQKEKPYWLKPWINGQTFFGHNPFVATAVFSEISMLKLLIKTPGLAPLTVDKKTGLNAFEWNQRTRTGAVNANSVLRSKPGGFNRWVRPLLNKGKVSLNRLFDNEVTEILTEAFPSKARKYKGLKNIDLELYKQFFVGEEIPGLILEDEGMAWASHYIFYDFSPETRIVLKK